MMSSFSIFVETIVSMIKLPFFIALGLLFVALLVCSIIKFRKLWIKYKLRKALYLHDTTHRTIPTHVHMQIYMVMWVLLAFFAVCGIFALTASSSDWLKWFAGIGVLLTWTCQDTIKDIVAYIILELNKMIKIGDWIIIEKLGIEGEVYDISITSVIVKNWDETLSSISTRTLLDTNMQNLQNVIEKKTSGRRMQCNFLINVHSIRDLSSDELDKITATLRERQEDASALLYAKEQGLTQNMDIYRIYLRHWMLDQNTVTRSPKFAIRLLNQSPEGLQMQLYAFLLPTKWEEFEQEQARIVQHVISSLALFGLVLFQYPGGTDTNKIHLMKG